jgi:Flp pilus assembly pilin Flp
MKTTERGQSKIEYALILSFASLAAIVVMMFLGPQIRDLFDRASSSLPTAGDNEDETPAFLQAIKDFQARIMNFYEKNGRWPRTWSPYNFTDIGLKPEDWDEPVDGLYLSPHGDEVGIANRKGDDLDVYVDDLDGKTKKLYDGWSIWCPVDKPHCYYHTVAPGNEVDISTIRVVTK